MENKMKEDIKRYCEFCSMCETYYIDVIGEACRCPTPKTEDEVNKELLSKYQKGEATL
jgi:hypothetical protein